MRCFKTARKGGFDLAPWYCEDTAMTAIKAIYAYQILDSRSTPTIEVMLETEKGQATASVPSGASVGAHEAHELRDEDGRGVTNALAHIEREVAPVVIGKDLDQEGFDALLCDLDGTPNKNRLGANAILSLSIAFARARALEEGIPLYASLGSLIGNAEFHLPIPLFNILNGGKHAKQGIDIQECMLAPIGFNRMRDRLEAAKKCMEALKRLLEENGLGTAMGDEGGFAPSLSSNNAALDLLVSAIEQSGYTTEEIKIALDIAATSFYREGTYALQTGTLSQEHMLHWYATLVKNYPIISIEDGFAEDDWAGFTALTEALGARISIVGDDLTVTNVDRIALARERNAANACIIKPNQIGTVTEAIRAVQAAKDAGWKIFASHRSGETLDAFISDFAVGVGADYLKAGAPTRPERLAKYNRLIEIEENL